MRTLSEAAPGTGISQWADASNGLSAEATGPDEPHPAKVAAAKTDATKSTLTSSLLKFPPCRLRDGAARTRTWNRRFWRTIQERGWATWSMSWSGFLRIEIG
jgi:hypothetical protein